MLAFIVKLPMSVVRPVCDLRFTFPIPLASSSSSHGGGPRDPFTVLVSDPVQGVLLPSDREESNLSVPLCDGVSCILGGIGICTGVTNDDEDDPVDPLVDVLLLTGVDPLAFLVDDLGSDLGRVALDEALIRTLS